MNGQLKSKICKMKYQKLKMKYKLNSKQLMNDIYYIKGIKINKQININNLMKKIFHLIIYLMI